MPHPPDLLLRMDYCLRLTRAVEERIHILYRQGKVPGGAFLSTGQEALSVGLALAMGPDDVICQSHRDMGALLVRGMTPGRIIAHHMGKAVAPSRGRDGSMVLGDLSLGLIGPINMLADNVPVAAGVALAMKMHKEPRVALCCIGEGATSRGDFHEGLNLAAVKMLPLVLIVNNNQYAYSTPVREQMRVENVADRAPAYGIPGVIVDGNDVVAVYDATRDAIARARAGSGPTLIEGKTMRMTGHSVHDDFRKYVPKSLLDEWAAKDPIDRMERRLHDAGLLTDQTKAEVTERIAKEMDEAVRYAEEQPYPPPDELLDDLYA